jgi:hypothetical protein
MWKIRRASIPSDLRHQFELFGVNVLGHAVGAGEHSSKGPELDRLLRQNRSEILEWLREKRDKAARRQTCRDVAQLVILFVAVIGATASVFNFFRH